MDEPIWVIGDRPFREGVGAPMRRVVNIEALLKFGLVVGEEVYIWVVAGASVVASKDSVQVQIEVIGEIFGLSFMLEVYFEIVGDRVILSVIGQIGTVDFEVRLIADEQIVHFEADITMTVWRSVRYQIKIPCCPHKCHPLRIDRGDGMGSFMIDHVWHPCDVEPVLRTFRRDEAPDMTDVEYAYLVAEGERMVAEHNRVQGVEPLA